MNHKLASTDACIGPSGDESIAPQSARTLKLTELVSGVDAQPQSQRLGIDVGSLRGISARLQVVVGEVPTTVGELVGYQDRQVVVLNRTLGDPVDLMLNGVIVARGHLVAVEGNFGVRICQVARQMEH